MKKLSTILFTSLLFFSCNQSSTVEIEKSIEPALSEIEEVSQEAPPNIRVVKLDSEESFLLNTISEPSNPLKYYLKAYFPDNLKKSCESNEDVSFDLKDALDAIYFHKVIDYDLKIEKFSSLDTANLSKGGFTIKPLSELTSKAGAKLIFHENFTTSDNGDDLPMIYGESDVRDATITNTALGINLKAQDAYLILLEDALSGVKHLSLVYKASNFANACITVSNDPSLYSFSCNLDASKSPLYTKCIKGN